MSGMLMLDPRALSTLKIQWKTTTLGRMKTCSQCKKSQNLTEFHKNGKSKDGWANKCKSCKNQYDQKHYQRVKPRRINQIEIWQLLNREQFDDKKREWRENNPHYSRDWAAKNKQAISTYKKDKYSSDIRYRLRKHMSNYIRRSIDLRGPLKWEELLGYKLGHLIIRLQSLFEPGMTWNNYGDTWKIGHIVSPDELPYGSLADDNFRICWSILNLQPIWK